MKKESKEVRLENGGLVKIVNNEWVVVEGYFAVPIKKEVFQKYLKTVNENPNSGIHFIPETELNNQNIGKKRYTLTHNGAKIEFTENDLLNIKKLLGS